MVTAFDARLLDDLAFYREVVTTKAAGLGLDQATTVRMPSGVTVLGVVQHLAWVEREWFGHCLLGEPMSDWEVDTSFDVSAATSVDAVVEDYRAACAASAAAVERVGDFDAPTLEPHWYFGIVDLRFVVVHMIKETSRHAGHLDILRELTDGATGFA